MSKIFVNPFLSKMRLTHKIIEIINHMRRKTIDSYDIYQFLSVINKVLIQGIARSIIIK